MLDTDTCIYLINRKPQHVIEHMEMRRHLEIGLSAITYSELMYGCHNSSRREKNLEGLLGFTIALDLWDFPAEAASTYGAIKSQMCRAGTLIGELDLLIAAHALHASCVLVTNNGREFSRVPDLKIENWVELT